MVRVFADGIELNNSPLTLGSRQIDGALEPIKGAIASGWVRERVREPTRAVLDMFVDGRLVRSVTADRLREELKAHGVDDGCLGYAEPLPASCFDGGVHEIEFRAPRLGKCYRARRPRLPRRLHRGARPARPAWRTWLGSLRRGARPAGRSRCRRQWRAGRRRRRDAAPRHPAARGIEAVGFEFSIPGSVSHHREIAVDIFVAGTANPALPGRFRFTPMSRVVEQLEAFAAGSAQAAPGGRSCLFAAARRDRAEHYRRAARPRPAQRHARADPAARPVALPQPGAGSGRHRRCGDPGLCRKRRDHRLHRMGDPRRQRGQP